MSSDFVSRLRLEANTAAAVQNLDSAAKAVERVGDAGREAQAGLNQAAQGLQGVEQRAEAAATAATQLADATGALAAETQAAAAALVEESQVQGTATSATSVRAAAVQALREIVTAAASEQLVFASAAREVAVAEEQAAAAHLAEWRAYLQTTAAAEEGAVAQLALRDAELALASAQARTTAAMDAEAAAQARLTAASTELGAITGGLRLGLGQLLTAVGGVQTIALIAAQQGLALLTGAFRSSEEAAKALKKEMQDLEKGLDLVVEIHQEAALQAQILSSGLDDEAKAALRAAAASRQHANDLANERKEILLTAAAAAQKRVIAAQDAFDTAQRGGSLYAGAKVGAPTPDLEKARAELNAARYAANELDRAYYELAAKGSGQGRRGGSGTSTGNGALGGAPKPEEEAKGHDRATRAIAAHAAATDKLTDAQRRAARGDDQAERDRAETELLERRAQAALNGAAALEALQVEEAGLNALRVYGVTSLDKLTGAERVSAAAAVEAAEAKERQAIATQKALRVGDTIRDLDRRVASEKARSAAIAGGVEAEVAYAKAEFERQAIERAGENLTDEQIAQIRAKADELFRVSAANDEADFAKQEAEELRLLKLTNQERAVEERYLRIRANWLAQGLDFTKQEVEARARAAALAEQAAADDAQAIGDLKQNLRDAFVRTGKLSFDDVGDYAEQKLREAVYNALLAEPIEVVIKAVVGNLSSLTGKDGPLSSLLSGSLGSVLGSALLGGSIGKSAGLGSGNGLVDTGLSIGGSALGSAAGSALGSWAAAAAGQAALTGASTALATTLGWLAPALGPIGAIAGLALGTLFKPKPSNNGALATLTPDGLSSITGAKRTDETTKMATDAANAVLQGEQILRAAGIKLNATVTSLDLGTRDRTDILLSDGRALTSAVGDAAAAAETALKAVLEGATYTNDAQKRLVESMLAAGKGFDDVAGALQAFEAAQALPQGIADAIQKLTDPKGYDVEQLKRGQAARRAELDAASAAGYLTAEQLSDLNAQLGKLEGLELDEVLKRYADAATDGAKKLEQAAALRTSVGDQILQITNPGAYKLKQVNDGIDAQVAQAQELIAAGALGADVLDQLEVLRNLQLNDALAQLASEANQAADAFNQLKPRMKEWLDQLATSPAAELSPQAQRDAAVAQFRSVLAQAQGGDLTAAGNLTSYADRALAADREATSNAQARLALYNEITGGVRGVLGVSAAPAQDPVVNNLQALGLTLQTIAANTDPNALASDQSVGKPVNIINLPSMKAIYGQALQVQTDALVAANDRSREELLAQLKANAEQQETLLTQLQATVGAGLAELAEATSQAVSLAAQQVQLTTALTEEQRLSNLQLRAQGQ